MPRRRRNPFYAVLGIVGFAFTITAMSYCLAVLRLVRPATVVSAAGVHPLHALMDRHGAGILAAELLLLAVATIGAVWLDHVEGERILAARRAERDGRRSTDRLPPDDATDGSAAGSPP